MFYDLLRPIPTYTEGPQIFKKIVIALIGTYLKYVRQIIILKMPKKSSDGNSVFTTIHYTASFSSRAAAQRVVPSSIRRIACTLLMAAPPNAVSLI